MKKYLSPVLIIALVFVLCGPAGAQNPNILAPGSTIGPSKGAVVGIIVGVVAAVAAVVIITVVVIHHSAKARTITGCVVAVPNGFTVNNERDNRVYALSGDIAGVKAGERMRLQGHKIDSSAGNPLGWQVSQIQKDYGACQP
jgi:hypothetical protein